MREPCVWFTPVLIVQAAFVIRMSPRPQPPEPIAGVLRDMGGKRPPGSAAWRFDRFQGALIRQLLGSACRRHVASSA